MRRDLMGYKATHRILNTTINAAHPSPKTTKEKTHGCQKTSSALSFEHDRISYVPSLYDSNTPEKTAMVPTYVCMYARPTLPKADLFQGSVRLQVSSKA